MPAARGGVAPGLASANAAAGPTWQACPRAEALLDGLRVGRRLAGWPAHQVAGVRQSEVFPFAVRHPVPPPAGPVGPAAATLADAGLSHAVWRHAVWRHAVWRHAGSADARAGAGRHRRRGHPGADAVFGRVRARPVAAGRSACRGGRSASVDAAEPVRAWDPERSEAVAAWDRREFGRAGLRRSELALQELESVCLGHWARQVPEVRRERRAWQVPGSPEELTGLLPEPPERAGPDLPVRWVRLAGRPPARPQQALRVERELPPGPARRVQRVPREEQRGDSPSAAESACRVPSMVDAGAARGDGARPRPSVFPLQVQAAPSWPSRPWRETPAEARWGPAPLAASAASAGDWPKAAEWAAQAKRGEARSAWAFPPLCWPEESRPLGRQAALGPRRGRCRRCRHDRLANHGPSRNCPDSTLTAGRGPPPVPYSLLPRSSGADAPPRSRRSSWSASLSRRSRVRAACR